MTVQSHSQDGQPHPVDLHVGALIRLRRKECGLSQNELAKALGLTFQQVQKYERGFNRVSASKLYEIARALNVAIAYFFDGLPSADDRAAPPLERINTASAFMMSPEGGMLMEAFPRIKSSPIRRQILQLVLCAASDPGEDAVNEQNTTADEAA